MSSATTSSLLFSPRAQPRGFLRDHGELLERSREAMPPGCVSKRTTILVLRTESFAFGRGLTWRRGCPRGR